MTVVGFLRFNIRIKHYSTMYTLHVSRNFNKYDDYRPLYGLDADRLRPCIAQARSQTFTTPAHGPRNDRPAKGSDGVLQKKKKKKIYFPNESHIN